MPRVINLNAGSAVGAGRYNTNNVMAVNGLSQTTTFYAVDGVYSLMGASVVLLQNRTGTTSFHGTQAGKELYNSGDIMPAIVHLSGIAISNGRVFCHHH